MSIIKGNSEDKGEFYALDLLTIALFFQDAESSLFSHVVGRSKLRVWSLACLCSYAMRSRGNGRPFVYFEVESTPDKCFTSGDALVICRLLSMQAV